MSFIKIIEDIENEISFQYMPGAIAYIDQNYDNAWSKALDRFDEALSGVVNKLFSLEVAQTEGDIYRVTILKLIGIYRVRQRGNKVEDFFNAVKAGKIVLPH